jgi:hypothetical protein
MVAVLDKLNMDPRLRGMTAGGCSRILSAVN